MKFKVGDKVKVIKCDISGVNCKNLNKVSTITEIDERNGQYPYVLRGTAEYFGEMELELLERQFTKSDLKDGDIVTQRNGLKKMVFENKLYGSNHFVSLTYYTEDLKDANGDEEYDIIKIERPGKYNTIFERKEEILDEVEKKYLANVIKPFRHEIKIISKRSRLGNSSICYIKIWLKNNDTANLPDFKENSMYKGMEPNREYSLKELGLE